MKNKTSKKDQCRPAGNLPGKDGLHVRLLLFATLAALLLPLLFSASGMFRMKVSALAIPVDYGDGYENRLDNLQPGDGIEAVSGEAGTYRIKYGSGENGFVTLARISQKNSLAGCTFRYDLGGAVTLGVNYDEEGVPQSDGSFFGIGSPAFPFKGHLVIGGANDTVLSIGEGGWRCLFNNISNEASITISADSPGRCIYSSYDYSGDGSSDDARNSFIFAKTLTVTADGEMDISGFRFGMADGSGHEGAVVIGDGVMALFAGEVKAGGGSAFSVDLSKSLTGGRYVVKSSDAAAAGIFGSVGAGVSATVTLPSSFRCEATSQSTGQANAGILVGSNHGTVTFKATAEDGTLAFLGSAKTDGSAGLIGANEEGSKAYFGNPLSLTMRAEGLRAGGFAGTGKGPVYIKSAEITDSEFTKTASSIVGRLGGAIGSVDIFAGGLIVEDGGSLLLSGNTFTATNACYIGGYIGYLKTAGADIASLTLADTTINGSGNVSDVIGGYIGTVETAKTKATPTNVRIAVDASDAQFTINGISAGICGGVIGNVNAGLYDKVEIVGAPTGALSVSVGNSSSAVVGGLVGNVTGYVRADGLSLTSTITRTTASADVAGTVAAGAVLELGGVRVQETNDSTLVAKTGAGSVLRLCGSIKNASASVLGIVYEQTNSLIYKDAGCTYTAAKSKNNDIGNYGQVFRNAGVLSFDATAHTVSVTSPLLDASGDEILLRDAGDFMRLAVTFYTNGSISGVTGADVSALYGKNIRIDGNVSLEGTGIEQLIPANRDTAFRGSIEGNGHTVTLAVGQNINGDFPGVYTYRVGSNTPNNARKNIGLFPVMARASVSNLTVNGTIKTDLLASGELCVGYLAGRVNGGAVSLVGCTFGGSGDGITLRGVERTTRNVGGAFGYVVKASGLSATGCSFGASIRDNTTPADVNDFYYGGLAGRVTYAGSAPVYLSGNNTIGTRILKTAACLTQRVGGLVGTLECDAYTQVNLRGTNASGVEINVNGRNDGSVGGILGHTFRNCRVAVNRAFAGSVSAGSANLGGLIFALEGRLDAEAGTSVDGLTLTSGGAVRGVLVADGKRAIVSVAADPSDFDGVTADGFDLFVGENIASRTTVEVAASGGIVTVETVDDGIGRFPEESGWYDLIDAHQNTKTRYYFNIAGISPTSGEVATPSDLIYWQLYDYASGVNAGARNELLPTRINDITASADINVTGYCFYPAAKGAVVVDFRGNRLTFGRLAKPASANQFFGLSAGLLSDLAANGADRTAVLRNIVVDGTVTHLGTNGSGALVCGTVYGSQPDAVRYTLRLTVRNVTLDGVGIEGSEAYRPVLINCIDSYVSAEISRIREGSGKRASAGSSLIGRGGIVKNTVPSSYVTVILGDVKLDGRRGSSSFTAATLFYDVSYVSGTGSIIYNFNFAEDWGAGEPHLVTYGAELTLDSEQKTYFDNEFFVHPTQKPAAGSAEFDFTADYLPYVYLHDAGAATNRGLSVNRKSTELTEGWGTYENPYIITTAKQLDDLCNWLSGNTLTFSDGWKINFPRGTWDSLSGLDLTGFYTVSASGNELSCTVDETKRTLDTDLLRLYLSGAYYKFIDGRELELSAEYSGIGSAAYPFHGVIHGNGGTVVLPEKTATENGYGFIRVANGCAVYRLEAQYSGISASESALPTSGAATTGPNNTGTIVTQIPHFGGVIARIVGGDNLIRNVTVTYGSIGNSACHAAIGGYVGLISGGGVLFDGITAISGIFDSATQMQHLYRNNYVGRVLEGYAVSVDGVRYENTEHNVRGDFIIPCVDLGRSAGQAYSGGTFFLGNAEELLIFSLALNSGALSGKNGDAYGSTAVSRIGDYSHVGEEYAGVGADGRYTDDTKKLSVLAAYFGIASPTDLRAVALTIRLTGSTYDMTDYGNAFRAMGGAYQQSTAYKIASFGSVSGATLKLDMDMIQYAAVKSASTKFCDDEVDRIVAYGIFGSVNGAISFSGITLEGKVQLRRVLPNGTFVLTGGYLDDSASTAHAVGGLLGKATNNVTLQNVGTTANGFTVVSPGDAGGFAGYVNGGTFTLRNDAGYDVRKLTVNGKRNTGGAVGYTNSDQIEIDGLRIFDAVIETRTNSADANGKKNLAIGVGGLVGYIGKGTVSISNSSTQKTAVVFYANYKAIGESGVGGIAGLVASGVTKFTAIGCTVDGGVVFSLANTSDKGTTYPYEDAASANIGIFDSEFLSALIYNGEGQCSAKVLAYLLTQKTSGSVYAAGGAGGIVGCGYTTFAFENCTVKAKAAPFVLASHNGAAGFVGEHRADKAISVKNCAIETDGYDLYIVGDTRSAGIVAYAKMSAAAYTVDGFGVVGSAAHPVRIVTYMYKSEGQATGLFGSIGKVKLTASNLRISYCIFSGTKAAAVYGTTTGSTIRLTNVHVENNIMYSISSYYAGGIFADSSATSPTLDGVYLANNRIITTRFAGGITGNMTSGTLYAKYVIMDGNILQNAASNQKVTDHTFVTKPIADDAALGALLKNPADGNRTTVGQFVGDNGATVTLIAVSYSDADGIYTANQVGKAESSGSITAVYAAHGAGDAYRTAGGYGAIVDGVTAQERAIKSIADTAEIDGVQTPVIGDSAVDGTPDAIDVLWQDYGKTGGYGENGSGGSFDPASHKPLREELAGIPKNGGLQIFCITASADETMKKYLNMLTGNGFSAAVAKNLVGVESMRYSVDANGVLTPLTKNGQPVVGSITYRNGMFAAAGVYDNLEGETKTLTILTITFAGVKESDVYTMHIALYYHRSVNLKTFVVPLEGEQYYLPSFSISEPMENSIRSSVTFGSPFTLYVEYNYNDKAMALEQISNFNKAIELTAPNGFPDANARIESGTSFVLIDLNSPTPSGYAYYVMTLTKDARFIFFHDFLNGENGFTHVDLSVIGEIGEKLPGRVCSDDGSGDRDCVYTERYLLVVFPVQKVTDAAMAYNMKAVIDEDQRAETNITVKRKREVLAEISVWGAPAMENTGDYIEGEKQFSNLPEEPIRMQVTATSTFPKDYVAALSGQGSGAAVYETHILELFRKSGSLVTLPQGTQITVTSADGSKEYYRSTLTSGASQVRFSVGNILDDDLKATYSHTTQLLINLDFSGVSAKDFGDTFSGSETSYVLKDLMYLSGNPDIVAIGPVEAAKEYTAKVGSTAKLAVVPEDNRYLGINLSDPEDETNSGRIAFSLNALFDLYSGKTYQNATITFSVEKKQYADGKYSYVPLKAGEQGLWAIEREGGLITADADTDTLPVVQTETEQEAHGEYTLVINLSDPTLLLTNYRLKVKLVATADDGTEVNAQEYFVFLVCRLNAEPDV